MEGETAAAGLGTEPEAHKKRQDVVTLADGSTIVVHKWSGPKYMEFLPKVGFLPHVPLLAEQSVVEADRERVRAMDFDDQLAISVRASALNVTPAMLKNLDALLQQRTGVEDALAKVKSPSKAS